MNATLDKIWRSLLKEERSRSAFLLLMMLMAVLFETAGIGLIIPFVSYLIEPDIIFKLNNSGYISSNLITMPSEKILIYGMIFLVIFFIIKNLFLSFFIWWQLKFSTDIRISISNRLFKKYLSNPYTFHLNNNSAILMRNISQEASRFQSTLNSTITLATEIFVILGLTILLLIIEPFGLIVSLVIMGSSITIYYFYARNYISFWANERVFNEGETYKHTLQGLSGIKDIKILNREKSFLKNFEFHNIKFSVADRWYSTLQLLPKLLLEILAVIMLVMLILIVTKYNPSASLIPVLAAFAAAAFRIMPSMNRILTSLQALKFSLPSVQIIFKELNDEDLLLKTKNEIKFDKFNFNKDLQIRNLTFKYDQSDQDNLAKVNLDIHSREFVGFVGPSGAGKSTLVNLILGLLEPTAGTIAVDGQSIYTNIRGWQKIIGYVPQDIYLIDDTIEKNIAFGVDENEIDHKKIKKCIEAAQLTEFVETLSSKLKTIVGERGMRISGGQLQRIGIARALYNNPKILVLDEATSSLDIETEDKVMDGINKLKGIITILIISHRQSTVAKCDKIYSISGGKVKL